MTQTRLHRNALASALALALFAPLAVQAQEQTQDVQTASDKSPTDVDEIVVTGSRIKRAEIEGPAPVTIITADQIKSEGFVTVYDVLTTLTEATGTVEADVQWGSNTPNASPLNLRNMGANHSLLLVNGRRVADYPLPYGGQSNFANYGNIPSAAIDRIEVLAGGASAIYGSDAIAGVINVILKQNYEGNEVRIRGGTSTEGGRDTYDLSWVSGTSGEKWNVTYALQWTKRDPLFGRDRPQMDDADDAPYVSWNSEQRKVGFRPSTGLALIDADTGMRLAPPTGTCEKFNGEYYLATRLRYNVNTDTITDTGQLCGMSSDFANWMLMSGGEDASGYLYGTWDFDNGMQAWATLAVHQDYGYWSTSPPAAVLPGAPDASAFYDVGSNRYLIGIRQFTPNEVGGLEQLRNKNKELSWDFSTGLRGVIADRFDWEASIGRSRYTVRESIATIDWDLAQNFFLGPQLGTTADGTAMYDLNEARWWNPISPQEYKQFATHSVNEASSWVNQGNFTISGDLFQGWAGPISFAAVVEAAEQGYHLDPDPRGNLDYEVQNIDRGGGSRRRYSAGVEFRVPLLESLSVNAATRYDRYGDYKADNDAASLDIPTHSDNTWNAGIEWRPLDSLLFRGSYATSFHAPDMHFLLAEPSSAFASSVDVYNCIASGAYLTDCGQGTPYYYASTRNRRGTPDLKSERGESWTVGFVWDIVENLSLTADYWKIYLEDGITDLSADKILVDEAGCRTGKMMDGNPWVNPGGAEYCSAITSRVTRDANGQIISVETGPINVAEKEVAGIDATLRYRWETSSWGTFRFGMNYTNVQSFKEHTLKSDPYPDKRDQDIRSKFRGSVSWEGGDWNANLYADRIGSVRSVRWGGCTPFDNGTVPNADFGCVDNNPASPTNGQQTEKYYGRVGPSITWNFNVGYQVTEQMRVNFYVNNVFNSAGWNHKDPYKLDYEFYNSRLFSPVGREVALEYVYKFD